jgi:hypothetical protein
MRLRFATTWDEEKTVTPKTIIIQTVLTAVLCVGLAHSVAGAEPGGDPSASHYLRMVREYADCLLQNGRDSVGEKHSPLIAAVMDRKTLKTLVADENWDARWKGKEFSVDEIQVRSHDRMPWGANPMHDQNLYQILYVLADVTGEKSYAQEADKTLKWFFDHCQSPATGLMAWGEHVGWNFRSEKFDGIENHEFFRPWILWDACYRLSPMACVRFARGLREHQVQPDGNFSRHARYSEHGPGANSNFPRHGGYYIATWARAYAHTKDEFFIKAIEVQLKFHRDSKVDNGIIPCASGKGYTEYWPPSLLSMAIDVHDGARHMPEPLGTDMLAFAREIDAMLAQSPGSFRAERMEAKDLSVLKPTTGHWGGSGYGDNSLAQVALMCRERYLQCKDERYRKAFLSVADELLTAELPRPDDGKTWEPGGVGAAILALVCASADTGKAKYLGRARAGAEAARALFFDAGNPLPKVTSTGAHYESITRADTLMMALLQLHIATSTGKLSSNVRYTDR